MAKVGGARAVGVSRDALRRARQKQELAASSDTAEPKRSVPVNEGDVKLYEPAARLQSGPRDGWVYYVSKLEAEAAVAAAMGVNFPYVRTRAHTTLPWTGGVKGEVWRYQPDLDQTAPPAAASSFCSHLGCAVLPHWLLSLSSGGRDIGACDAHADAIGSAMSTGLSGSTTGSAWVNRKRIRRAA